MLPPPLKTKEGKVACRRQHTFVGTSLYMSPEMLSDVHIVDFGADLWGFGCIIYTMLCGNSPFVAECDMVIFQRILARDLEIPSFLSEDAVDIIQSLLQLVPSQRLGYSSIANAKNHRYFRDLDFSILSSSDPPFPSGGGRSPCASDSDCTPRPGQSFCARNVSSYDCSNILQLRRSQSSRFGSSKGGKRDARTFAMP